MSASHDFKGDPPIYNDIHRFFELSIDLLAITSNGFFVRLNLAWEQALGYSREELMSRPATDFVHPDDLGRTETVSQQMSTDGGTVINFENRYRCKDGSYKWLEWTARRFPGEELAYCVARDVTARKQAEEALHQSERTLREFIDASPHGALLIDPNGTLIALNANLPILQGTESVGRNIYELLPSEYGQRLREAVEQVLETRQTVRYEDSEGGRYFEQSLAPIFDLQSKVIRIAIFVHDITHLKQTEANLRQSEQVMRELLNGVPDSAIMSKLDGTILMVNERQAGMYGKPVDEVVGKTIFDFAYNEDMVQERKRWIEELRATKKARQFVTERNGRYLEVYSSPIVDDQGNITAVVTSSHDITHLKKTEESLRQSEQTLRALLDGIPNFTWMVRPDGLVLAMNQRMAAILGQSVETVIGQNIFKILTDTRPEVVTQRRALIDSVCASGQPMVTELEANGRYVESTFTPMKNADGEVTAIVISNHDITRLKEIEEALRQSEHTMRALLDGLPTRASLITPEGIVIQANEKQAQFFANKAVEEIIGKSIYDLVPNERFIQQCKAWIQQVIETKQAFRTELEMNGFYSEVMIVPIINTQGEAAALVVSTHNITHMKQTEEALRQSGQALRGLLDGMPSYAFMIRPDGTILSLNQRMAAVFQKEREQLIGQNYFDIAGDVNVDETLKARFEKAVRTRSQEIREFEFGDRHFESSITPITNDQGEVVALVTASHDITRLKKAEESVRQSEKKFRSVLESAAEGILLTDAAGTIVLVNQQIETQFGYNREELIGQSVDILLPEAQRSGHGRHRQGYIAHPDMRPMGIGRDLSGRRKGGSVFPVEVSLSYIENDGELLLMALVVDITERKQAEIALRKSEEQFRSVLESAAEGILVTDAIGNIVLINREIELQFGYNRDELIGASVDILLPEGLRTIHFQHRQEYMEKPDIRSMGVGRELMGRRKDGSVFPIEVSLSYTHSDDLLVMAFIVDISERKQIENERIVHEKQQAEIKKERELIQLRQQFIGMISHEFRTPLTAIASSCELLEHYYQRLNEEQRLERIGGLNAHVRTMVGLLDDILMLNKIQAGMATFNPQPLDIAAVAQSVLDTARLIDQKRHELVYKAENLPNVIQGDRRILEHILSNLLTNAIKYSPTGTQIDFELAGRNNDVVFMIKDRGRGIPKVDHVRLFEPFHRAGNVGSVQGTGLGLAIVKSNTELHGGSIRFESIEDQGTTFWVEIPINMTSEQ